MKSTFLSLLGAGFYLAVIPASEAAFSLTDIEFWAGPESGPGISEAALVIDWNDGQTPLAWGYRWDATLESPTGQDLLGSVVSADSRFDVGGLDSFISHISYDTNLDGEAERFRPGWDGVSQFWAYYVNNEVFEHPDDFTLNGHIVEPNTEVMPTGDPYDPEDPGTWYQSSTGASDRPLVDGSWDGWVYSDGTIPVGEPAAAPIPEPNVVMLLLASFGMLTINRRRTNL